MEESVARLFTDDIREEAARAFGAGGDSLESLGDFESYVYGYEADGENRVLRITHPSHRSAEQIEAELHWVEYLAERGVRFARPVRTRSGSWTHTVDRGEAVFHACAFERVPGRMPTAADFGPELFTEWGRFLGRTHALTRDYEPPSGTETRYSWSDDPYIQKGRSWIPEVDGHLRDQWTRTFDEMGRLPQDRDSFGICHTDLHPYNFHVHEGRIFGFDTDDCSYNWFVEDLSSVFYYGTGHEGAGKDRQEFFSWAWPAFWRAYKAEHNLDPIWLDRIHLFQRARVLTLFALLHMKFEPGDEEREPYLPKLRRLLERDGTILDFNYEDV